jgi:ATP-dependent DNA ligase
MQGEGWIHEVKFDGYRFQRTAVGTGGEEDRPGAEG